MPEVRIGEIISAVEFEVEGEQRIVIDARVSGDVRRFLEELKEHGLSIFLTIEPEACGIKGTPDGQVLACELKAGHKGAYHRNGRFRWIGYHVEDKTSDRQIN